MSNLLILFTYLLCGITNPDCSPKETSSQEQKITTYYLIRHAEKDRTDTTNSDPNLNEQGKKRALKWAEVLKEINLDAVYSTNYKRTMQTAMPAAKDRDLSIKNYDPRNLFDEEFKNSTAGKTVLIVGHSNTTPQFVNAILKQPKYGDLDDSENGALFIVQVLPDGKAICQVLYIN